MRTRLSAIVVTMALGTSRFGEADEIPKVTITASGPDTDLPLGKPFYIVGSAKEVVKSAHVFIVRKGSRTVFVGDRGPACSVIKDALHADQQQKRAVDAGVHRLREVYPAVEDGYKENHVLASARWERKDAKGDQEYKLLVSGDRSFFQSGFHYCLFVETGSQEMISSEKEIGTAIDTLVNVLKACTTPECGQSALQTYENNLLELAQSVLGKTRASDVSQVAAKATAFRAAGQTLVGHTLDVRTAVDRVGRLKDSPIALDTLPAGDVTIPITADSKRSVPIDHLAHAAALLLVWNPGKIGIRLTSATSSRFSYGDTPILSLGISANAKFLAWVGDGSSRSLDVGADALEVRPGVTLGDLVRLMNNQVLVGARKYSFPQLRTAIQQGASPWTKEQTELVVQAHQKFFDMSDALLEIARARTTFDEARKVYDDVLAAFKAGRAKEPNPRFYADDTGQAILAHLGRAIEGADGAAITLQEWSQALNKLARSHADLAAAKGMLSVKTEGLVAYEASAPIATSVEFTESTWVFSYLTPVLGYAQLRTDGNFALFYTAVQLHLVPNRGDDVLWSNGFGQDWKRAFALELGFSPKVSSFGPDKRLSGYSGFPPVYFGVALHIIPYTSISLGGVLLDRKSSTLADEKPDVTFKPYVGFNVQFNLPEYVREASKPATNATVTTH